MISFARLIFMSSLVRCLLVLGLVLGFAANSLADALANSEAVTIDLSPRRLPPAQTALVKSGAALLEQALISYVYGGYKIGDGQACDRCNSCLELEKPRPSERLKACGMCRDCSLDCSHFTQLVYQQAGFPYPYIETASMLSLSAVALERRYQLTPVGRDPLIGLTKVQVGDLLVYKGHVVMLEHLYPATDSSLVRGDVIHATGGRDIKAPGQGIQRERYADLANFRGPLLRILRHVRLNKSTEPLSPKASGVSKPTRKPQLRPVARSANAETND